MAFHVPSIDITPYVSDGTPDERAAVAAAVDDAARTVGFMQILGHGIPAATTDGLAAALDSFFSLDLEAKKAYRTPPQINRGYSPPKSESLSLSLGVESANRMNDFFEAFNVGAAVGDYPDSQVELPADDYAENVWPGAPETVHFRAQVEAYFPEAARVARTMTRIFEDALGLEPGFYDRYASHSLDVLRMNNYALPPGRIELDGDLVGMGEHTDYGIVTVLWADQVKGLQVLGRDGSWNDVSPADDALLINLGDVTGRWTNDQWMSTLHRVKPPIVGGTIERRRSAAFFHDGDIDAVIATMPGMVDAEHPDRYPESITVGEHIRRKLAGSRAGTKNDSAGSEKERVLSSQA
ncbi:2-oxoglutarate and iron-dependent oxygenase domain-containing protein [soil metagenome]